MIIPSSIPAHPSPYRRSWYMEKNTLSRGVSYRVPLQNWHISKRFSNQVAHQRSRKKGDSQHNPYSSPCFHTFYFGDDTPPPLLSSCTISSVEYYSTFSLCGVHHTRKFPLSLGETEQEMVNLRSPQGPNRQHSIFGFMSRTSLTNSDPCQYLHWLYNWGVGVK